MPAKSNFSALGTVPAIIADMVLLLIILAGLLVMCYCSGGMFDLTCFLWKQVMVLNFHFNSFIYFHKGVIWLVLGFAAEVPPLVSTDVLSISLLFKCLIYVIDVHLCPFEWYFLINGLYMISDY